MLELVSPATLAETQTSIQAGGDGVRDGVAILLAGILDYRENERTGGVNGSQVLATAMRRLTEDPYLTLGLEPDSDEGAVKKSYRKLALRYHPDKNKATPTLFQAVQGAHVSRLFASCRLRVLASFSSALLSRHGHMCALGVPSVV